MTFCQENICTQCCLEADVLLLQEDIDRLIMTGYYDVYFSEDVAGAKIIRKVDGKCIFFKNGRCEVYHIRPKRCQLYPLSYDDDTGTVHAVEICRYKNNYKITGKDIAEMEEFVARLKKEIEKRRGYNPARAALGRANTHIQDLR